MCVFASVAIAPCITVIAPPPPSEDVQLSIRVFSTSRRVLCTLKAPADGAEQLTKDESFTITAPIALVALVVLVVPKALIAPAYLVNEWQSLKVVPEIATCEPSLTAIAPPSHLA